MTRRRGEGVPELECAVPAGGDEEVGAGFVADTGDGRGVLADDGRFACCQIKSERGKVSLKQSIKGSLALQGSIYSRLQLTT